VQSITAWGGMVGVLWGVSDAEMGLLFSVACIWRVGNGGRNVGTRTAAAKATSTLGGLQKAKVLASALASPTWDLRVQLLRKSMLVAFDVLATAPIHCLDDVGPPASVRRTHLSSYGIFCQSVVSFYSILGFAWSFTMGPSGPLFYKWGYSYFSYSLY
jgi:hypothetical protein